MELSELVDHITAEITDSLPEVLSLGKLRESDPALFAEMEPQIGARVADAITETVLAMFRILGSGAKAQRVL